MNKNFTMFFLKIILISIVLFGNLHLGTITLFHFSILVSIPFILFNKNFRFSFDEISKVLLFYFISILFSYLVNLRYYNSVSKIYLDNTNESPSYLYIKIFISGVFLILCNIYAFQLGLWLSRSRNNCILLCNFLFFLFSLNATVDVFNWLYTTGGVIGRYNFNPPLTGSPGTSITFSSLGFLLGIAKYEGKFFKYRFFTIILLTILLLSIIITLTRLSQVAFAVMLLLYFFQFKKIISVRNILVLFLFAILVLVILFLFSSSDSFSIYGTVDSAESIDLAVRLSLIQSSFDLFLSHPITGVGYGMFPGQNTTPVFFNSKQTFPSSPHNGLLSILSEQGIVGLVFIIIIIWKIIRELKKSIKFFKNDLINKYLTSIYSSQVVYITLFLFSNFNLFGPPTESFSNYFSFISWLLIGAVLGLKNQRINHLYVSN